MDFLKAVNEGLEKSGKSVEAISQVNEVFSQINNDLKQFSAGELSLERGASLIARTAAFHGTLMNIESEYLQHDKLVLKLKTDVGVFTVDVAGWKQRATGFPCILKFNGQELSCGNPEHLREGIAELFASIGFGNAVRHLMNKSSEAGLPSPDTARSGDATSETIPGEAAGSKPASGPKHHGDDDRDDRDDPAP